MAVGDVEFYLAVVTPDSAAAGVTLSPSSASSGADSAQLVVRSERREVGDGSTCYDDDDGDLICATMRRGVLQASTATGAAAWNCELCSQCERRSSSTSSHARTTAALPPTTIHDEYDSTSSNHRCSWTSCRDRCGSARMFGPTTNDRTIPRRHVAAPGIRARLAGSDAAESTSGSSAARRPRSWCSCMHVDNRLQSSDCRPTCPSDVAEPRSLPRCGDATGNDRCHVTSVDRRCRHTARTASSRASLRTT